MIARLYSLNKQFINLKGKLLALPKLIKAFIMDALGYGWDRNRAIDTIGTHNNALMGGYLLAASNTTITISGLLKTDTLISLTTNGLVGTIATNNIISFTTGNNYGAFEVYRGTTRIGRYCLTERQGLQIINQTTGGLPNGLLGGTTTTVWQRSNAFYCETNHSGYSISGTGWVTSAGSALTVGTIIPADPLNLTKCMAWVSGVQQDLQYVGKAKNSVSVVPLSTWCNADRYWVVGNLATSNTTSIEYTVYITPQNTTGVALIVGQLYSNTHAIYYVGEDRHIGMNVGVSGAVYRSNNMFFGTTYKIVAGFINSNIYITVTDVKTGYTQTKNWTASHTDVTSAPFYVGSANDGTLKYMGYFAGLELRINGILKLSAIQDQHSTSLINTANGSILVANGVTTNQLQNVDLVYDAFNQTGYELWYNGTDYLIYPLSSTGTRIITPAGYTLDETVTAGNMPSVADSRMSTFKYALANSYALRQSVPEAFDATDLCAPKLLTYSELSALSANPKVIKTEVNGKITNLKIIQ